MGDMVVNIPRIGRKEDEVNSEKLHVIVNEIGLKVIKVIQVKRELKAFGGAVDIQWQSKIKRATEVDPGDWIQNTMKTEATWQTTPSGSYVYAFVGATIPFIPDPYPQGPTAGTGLVCYLIDDNMPTPKDSRSGEKNGYNRELLATHYGEGYFTIVDEEIRADVRSRYDRIQEYLKLTDANRKKIFEAAKERSMIVESQMQGKPIQQKIVIPESMSNDGAIKILMNSNQELMKKIEEMERRMNEKTTVAPIQTKQEPVEKKVEVTVPQEITQEPTVTDGSDGTGYVPDANGELVEKVKKKMGRPKKVPV